MAKEINASSWEEDVAKVEDPVVVEFWHEQCGWCLKLAPIYEELSQQYNKAMLVKLNVRSSGENAAAAAKYGVLGTPTMKVFCEGREVGELVGFMAKEELMRGLDEILERAENCLRHTEPLG